MKIKSRESIRRKRERDSKRSFIEMASILETTIAQLEGIYKSVGMAVSHAIYHERYTYAGRVSHVPVLLLLSIKARFTMPGIQTAQRIFSF